MTRPFLRAPLDRLPSLKLRLGLLIVLALGVTLTTMWIASALGVRLRLAALTGLVVSLLAVQVVARGTTSPLRELARAAGRIAGGERGVRVVVHGRDEVARLGDAFNTMAAELEETDRIRRDLVADAAHELRTPVAALRAALENAADGVQPADPEELLGQVVRLGDLADVLLDLSRLDAGASTLERRRVTLADLVDVPVDAPEGLLVDADPDRLRQVLGNLLQNAERHAPGATVVVRARATPTGGVRIEVEDDGPGLDAGDALRVFERFARSDRSRTTPGSGLGLAISRSIVELHGGTIRAEAVVPHGCRMVVELPAGGGPGKTEGPV
ncbi:sensor histidine kinase [Patulibacter minatonensis]|uniref:sensor histidine kinase n=1 Tax=Patulibacter minatonensis TaxID=298163 RepID=UPI000685AAE8|nr:ATP-binding protein [Patulibacter minatonensis]